MNLMKKEYTKPQISVLTSNCTETGLAKGTESNEGNPAGMATGMMIQPS